VDVTWSKSTFCEAAFETPEAMCSGSGVSEDVPPHRASLRKAALAWIVGYLYTAVDPCQMYFEQYVIVIFTVG
jgi:hypothetical protein